MNKYEDKQLTSEDVYSLDRVLKMRENVRATVRKTSDTKKYMDLEFDDGVWGLDSDDIIGTLVPVFAAALSVEDDVVRQSLYSLLRTDDITVAHVDKAAWIMAGNQRKLQAGEPVEPFTNVLVEEWVPAFVVDYERCWRYGRRGGLYFYKIMGGTPASHKFQQFFADDRSSGSLEQLRRMFALPAWKHCTYRGIVGMRGWLHLDPTKSQERGRPHVSHIECNSAFRAYNRDIFKRRRTPCDLDKSWTQWDCQHCQVGLLVCERATHSVTYVAKDCAVCSKQGFFPEDDHNGRVCLSCQEHKRIRIGKERR